MSKIGKLPIQVPDAVKVEINDYQITVEGPKGKLIQHLPKGINVKYADQLINVERLNDRDEIKAYHGLIRTLINNMVKGVSVGWQKNLELIGTGYRAQLQGNNLSLSIGYSHPVVIEAPQQISFQIDAQTKIAISGIDRQLVGQVAAKIRAVRPPEPYKGKGIRYQGEKIRRKAGKAASGGTA